MSAVSRGVDALGIFLTGGASNKNPDLSLGGVLSSTRVRGLGHLTKTPVPAIRIDNVYPACGEGEATLLINPDDDVVFTPPGGVAGTPVTIAVGAGAIVAGQNLNKAIRVFRETGLDLEGIDTIDLREAMNGVLAQNNVTDAQRVAGVTTYRALALDAQGAFGVLNVGLWLPPVTGLQATYSIAIEDSALGSIQTIADELTAPSGLSFVSPATEGAALVIVGIDLGQFKGLWIKKTFPVGVVSARENVQLAMKYLGA